MKYSVALAINGYGLFAFIHKGIDSIGMAAAIEIAENIFKDTISLLPESELIVLRIVFENKKELFAKSFISVFLSETGQNQKSGAESLLLEVVNKLHKKIMTKTPV